MKHTNGRQQVLPDWEESRGPIPEAAISGPWRRSRRKAQQERRVVPGPNSPDKFENRVGSQNGKNYLLQQETQREKSNPKYSKDKRENPCLNMRLAKPCSVSLGDNKDCFSVFIVLQRYRKIKFHMQWIWLTSHFKCDQSARVLSIKNPYMLIG